MTFSRMLMIVVCMAVAVHAAVAQSTDESPSISASSAPQRFNAPVWPSESMPFPRASRWVGLRVLPDRFVHGEVCTVVIEYGIHLSASAALTAPRSLRCTLRCADAPDLPLRLQAVPSTSGTHRLWRGSATVSAATWSDGIRSVECHLDAALPKPLTALSASASLRVVRARVAAVQQDRSELVTWIEEANRRQPIWGRMPLWPNLDIAVERSAAPFADLRGAVLRSYDSDLLGRRQPYTVLVPRALDLSKPAPLMILLHGSGGDYRNAISDLANGQDIERFPMLIANAGMMRYQEYRHMALHDVRAIIADMCRKYAIDSDRIYISGISLGGRGALEAAALLPDTFAAVSAQGAYGQIECLVDPLRAAQLDAVAFHLAARRDLRTWLANMAHIPSEIVVGSKDLNTPPSNGLLFADMLRDLGGTTRTLVLDTDHSMAPPHYSWSSTREWLLRFRRSKPDERTAITHRLTSLRYGSSGGLGALALQDYSRFATLQGQRTVSADGTVELRVTTDNIAILRVDAATMAQRVIINDSATFAQQQFPALYDVRAVPRRCEAPALTSKHPGRSGPLWDAWNDSVIYVHDDRSASAAQLRASAIASATWDLASGSPLLPVLAASQLTQHQRTANNLIVFTDDPQRCPALAGVDIPLLSEVGAPGTVSVVLRPAPWSDNTVVVVVIDRAQRPFDLSELGEWDAGTQADWLVVRPLPARSDNPHPGAALIAGGIFDGDWKPAARTTIDWRGAVLLGPAAK